MAVGRCKIVEVHGLSWVEFHDDERGRYLGKMNLRTGELLIPYKGETVRFDLPAAVKSADGRHDGTPVLK
jgi:hypothetical protein